jgi:hypothetical protein
MALEPTNAMTENHPLLIFEGTASRRWRGASRSGGLRVKPAAG